MIGVAVTGLGVGEQHARAYAADSRAKLLWLHDLDRSRAERLAAQFPGSRVAPSYEALLADPAVKAVSIASFDGAHFAQARDALRAGKHVFVEKPMGLTAAECDRIMQAASKAKKLVLVGHVLPLLPEYAFARKAIASGKYGKLLGGHFKRVISDPLWL